jgi:hypothetical protein
MYKKTIVKLIMLLCIGVLSQTADTTVTVRSVLLPQLLSLSVHLGVRFKVVSTTRLVGQYGLGGPSRRVPVSWSNLSSTYSPFLQWLGF